MRSLFYLLLKFTINSLFFFFIYGHLIKILLASPLVRTQTSLTILLRLHSLSTGPQNNHTIIKRLAKISSLHTYHFKIILDFFFFRENHFGFWRGHDLPMPCIQCKCVNSTLVVTIKTYWCMHDIYKYLC